MDITYLKRNGSHQHGIQCIYIQPFYMKCLRFYANDPADAYLRHYLDEEGYDLYDEENLSHPIIALQHFQKEFSEYFLDVTLLLNYLASVLEIFEGKI